MPEIKTLLKTGLDKTYRTSNGCSLFYYMIEHDLKDGVEMLLEWQASVDNVDGRGKTAMCLAAEKDRMTILQNIQKRIRGE